MTTLFFIVIGGLSLRKLPVDLYPDVSYPVLAVRANLPGAAPEEIEEIVTKPMEDGLSSLAGLTNLRSMSREGSSTVVLEFDSDVDIKFQEMQVRAKVANLRPSMPEDLSEPVVYRQDPDDTPIIELAITGKRTASELTRIIKEDIADRIRQIPGVGDVEMGGEREREVIVELKPEALEAWRINVDSVVDAIKAFNGNDPIGTLEGQGRVWLLRSISHVKGVHDLKTIPVGHDKEGQPILLGEVAEISEGFKAISRISRISDGKNLQSAIDLDIKKQSGENTVAVSDGILEQLEKLRETLPSDIEIHVIRDNAELVRTNVKDVFETLVIGAILTIIVVLLFLRSPRATVTTGLSLPSSIITTFAVMAVAGFTINVMTLLALSLAIGLLVDDAIVVRENIFRHLQTKGTTAADAALKGTKEVALAVTATTLTIVAVFLPVGFMGGTTGQFFQQFAVTVVFAIMISLWDALTMAPMLSTYFANIADPEVEWRSMGAIGRKINSVLERFEHLFTRLETRYKAVLAWLLPKPWISISLAGASLAVAILGFTFISKSFLPTQLGYVFSVGLNGPLALPVERISEVADAVDERMKTVKGLEYWTMRSGRGYLGNASINMTVRVRPDYAKDQEALAEVRTETRKAIDGFIGYTTRISEPSDPLSGGGSGRFQPVAVMVSGGDLGKIRDLAREVKAIMEDIDGVTDVMALQDEGLPELELMTAPKLAGHFGVTPKTISQELRTWIEGDTSNKLQLGSERIPIRVRLKEGEHLTANSLLAKSIFTNSGTKSDVTAVPIGSTVNLVAGAGPPMISRENRQKIMRVGANLKTGAPLGDIVSKLETALQNLPMPDGYRIRIVGQNEQMKELFTNVAVALLLGCLFMYMILASLFESFSQPFTVMAAVPLAATGAVLALLLFGIPLDLYGGIGMILLAGIVAKNSILLVDFAMQRVRDKGDRPYDAILESAPLRLRPILMTSVAMIAGMLPVATGLGVGGAARQALGVATIGGIISSTILTLVIVPNLYIAVEKITGRFKKAK